MKIPGEMDIEMLTYSMREESGNETANHQKLNPLLVDLVLNDVMTYLTRDDLWSAREVCWKWNQFATWEMVQRSQKSLYFQENMEEFLETMKTSFNIPFVNFALCLGRFTSSKKILMLGEFFKICGPTLKQLELQMDCRTIGVNFLGPSLSQSVKELPELESLKVWYDSSNDEFIGQEQLSFFYSFLSIKMPNLKSLTFCNNSPRLENQVVTDLFCISIDENTFPYLKKIVLQANITNENLTNLSKSKVKFQNIDLLFKNSNFDSKNLTEFIESQQTSLQFLKLTGPILCQIPQLKNLIDLDLNTIDSSVVPFRYENRNNFPRLKKIKLAASMLHDVFQSTGNKISTFPSVEKLHFYKHLDNSPRTVVPQLSIHFPNLKKLRMKFTPHWVTCVFENLVNLEELFIDENNLASYEHDSVFTGIPSETCNSLTQYTKDTDVENLRVNPSLTNLKKLKILRLINLNRMYYGSKCTDITGYFAFLRMPSLESVATYLNGFSDQCLGEMKKKFDVTSSLDYLRRKQI